MIGLNDSDGLRRQYMYVFRSEHPDTECCLSHSFRANVRTTSSKSDHNFLQLTTKIRARPLQHQIEVIRSNPDHPIPYHVNPQSIPHHTSPERSSHPAPLDPLQHLEDLLRRPLRIVISSHVGERHSHSDRLAVRRRPVVLHVSARQQHDYD
jgi:formyltetrahydrofolate hydrolase